MIRHIVMWKVKKENKKENLSKMKKDLEALKNKINLIIDWEVGIGYENTDENSAFFDIVLNSTFATTKDLADYKFHPDHVVVEEFIKSITYQKSVVDFEK